MYQDELESVKEETVEKESVEELSKATSEEKPSTNNPKDKKNNNEDECYDLVKATSRDDVVQQIETKRKDLLAQFTKTKNVSRILMLIVVVAVIGAIIMIFNDLMALKIVGYCLAGVVLAGMIVYYTLSKDKFPKASKEYIASVTNLINSYDFDDPRFSELKVYPNRKLNKTELEVDRVYKNAIDIGSRNFISGCFEKTHFEVSENVLYNAGSNRKSPRVVAFLGKYISLTNDKKISGRYIFNLKGNPEKLVDQPNDIDDLTLVLEEDNLQVYAPNDKPIKDVFGTKFISKLKEIKTDDKLLNLVVVVWAGHTAIYLSYDDSVTVLPFEHEFNVESQDKYKSDLVAALELVTLK